MKTRTVTKNETEISDEESIRKIEEHSSESEESDDDEGEEATANMGPKDGSLKEMVYDKKRCRGRLFARRRK